MYLNCTSFSFFVHHSQDTVCFMKFSAEITYYASSGPGPLSIKHTIREHRRVQTSTNAGHTKYLLVDSWHHASFNTLLSVGVWRLTHELSCTYYAMLPDELHITSTPNASITTMWNQVDRWFDYYYYYY